MMAYKLYNFFEYHSRTTWHKYTLALLLLLLLLLLLQSLVVEALAPPSG
jgi:hypothetical protein